MMYGLSNHQIKKIQNVFANYKSIDKAILYGSRAKGNYRESSDIDLSIVGKTIDLEIILKVENELDDLLLPQNIDLSIFYKIENESLIEHIERVGIVFYEKNQKPST